MRIPKHVVRIKLCLDLLQARHIRIPVTLLRVLWPRIDVARIRTLVRAGLLLCQATEAGQECLGRLADSTGQTNDVTLHEVKRIAEASQTTGAVTSAND
jgi:hypothetical protein